MFPRRVGRVPPVEMDVGERDAGLFAFVAGKFEAKGLAPRFRQTGVVCLPGVRLKKARLFVSRVLVTGATVGALLLVTVFFLRLWRHLTVHHYLGQGTNSTPRANGVVVFDFRFFGW